MYNYKLNNGRTLLTFIEGETKITLGKGQASAKVKRGTTKFKDKIKAKTTLIYQGLNQGLHHFKSNETELLIAITEEDNGIKLTFKGAKDYNRLWLSLTSHQDEKFYGCGEQFTHLNLKNQSVKIWVSEHHSVKKLVKKFLREKIKGVNPDYIPPFETHASYHSQPTFISSECYFVHVNSRVFQRFSFNKDETILYMHEIPKSMVIKKTNSFLALSEAMSKVIGKQERLPSFTEEGIIISVQGGTKVIDQVLAKAKTHDLKVSAVWAQDWSGQLVTKFGEQVYWNWTLDQTRYSDLRSRVKEWQKEGIHFLGYINPFFKENSKQFNEAKRLGYLVKNKKGYPYLVKSTTFNAGMIDLTNQDAFDYMKKIIKNEMINLGFSGWMADFGEYLPLDAVLKEGKAEHVHNMYPELWAKCNHEAIKESKQSCFFFSRAAFTATLKYTNAMWAGDQHVDFSDAEGLGSVIPAFLSMSVSGVGINHSDIGGYTTIFHMKRSSELLIRWAELAVFTPLFRAHEGNLPKKNAQVYDEENIKLMAKLTKIFVALSPYLNAMKEEYYLKGIPVIRPLFYHFDEAFAFETTRIYMYGSELLIAPVLRADIKKHSVHLPKGEWVHLMTKETYKGGHHLIDAPLGMPHAFYQKNAKYRDLFNQITDQ